MIVGVLGVVVAALFTFFPVRMAALIATSSALSVSDAGHPPMLSTHDRRPFIASTCLIHDCWLRRRNYA